MRKYSEIKALFFTLFGPGEEPRLFFAPGRVNLIGEHIDYNGGFVFPAALELGNYALARPNGTGTVRLAAEDLDGTLVSCPLDGLDAMRGKAWGAYQLGVCDELQKAHVALEGCDLLFFSTLPFGAGLSSSASIEVVTGFALLALNGQSMGGRELALLCQRAENNFVGVNCGIMDQYACANGERGCGMLLDCDRVESEQVPLNLGKFAIVVGNTNKKRGLADSKYNERRAECDEALAILQRAHPGLKNLCALSAEEFEAAAKSIENKTVRNRAAHAVLENGRVKRAAELLREGDIVGFGRLLEASHASLRDLYEVTGPELDALAEAARAAPGCAGSRMTGAGFGGCAVSIVERELAPEFIAFAGESYAEKTGLRADFYVSDAGDGVRELSGEGLFE